MNVLGTVFETSLRILLLLSVIPGTSITEDRIWMIDYLSLYSEDFGFSSRNLHGYGAYRAGEYPAKRALAKDAIKSLVLDHQIAVKPTASGFRYSITEEGMEFCKQFTSDYSEDYITSVKRVVRKVQTLSDRQILVLIQNHAEADKEG